MKVADYMKECNIVDGSYDLSILVISDFTVEHFFDSELKDAFKNYAQLHITNVSFDIFVEEISLFDERFDFIIIWVDLSNYAQYQLYAIEKEDFIYNELYRFYVKIKEKFDVPVIWMGFDSYEDDLSFLEGNIISKYNLKSNLNYRIKRILQKRDVMINVEKIIFNIGAIDSYNKKYKYNWACVYTKKVFKKIALEVLKQYKILYNASPKCVVLDCDNVLWGGILSEDGVENIKLGNLGLGKLYQDFQRMVLQMYYHGVIIAIVSKNDIEDVKKVFQNHSGMILKDKHIAIYQVNWNNKVENIKKVSDMLNISLESMVFIDDSVFEINLVNSMLPMVKTILFNRFSIFDELDCFNASCEVDLKNIETRNKTYKANIDREKLYTNINSYEDYLEALKMKVEIKRASNLDYSRVAELSLRANKKTNGKRYTVEKLKEVIKDSLYSLYIVTVSDKYSDLGIVGIVGVYGDRENAELDLFCLSCRALGRNIENIMFEEINKRYKIKRVQMYKTPKNKEFLAKLMDMYL